jgi:hypothetical protein
MQKLPTVQQFVHRVERGDMEHQERSGIEEAFRTCVCGARQANFLLEGELRSVQLVELAAIPHARGNAAILALAPRQAEAATYMRKTVGFTSPPFWGVLQASLNYVVMAAS